MMLLWRRRRISRLDFLNKLVSVGQRPTDALVRPVVDLRNWASPVDDQYDLGSCTANAIVNAYELLVNQLRPAESVELSRLFVYYNAREADGDVNSDNGTFIQNGLKAVQNFGICTEELWPYDITQFTVCPNYWCYQDAKSRKISKYERIPDVSSMTDALNNNKPVTFGIAIYDEFDRVDSKNSVVPLPDENSKKSGGHAMCMVGYDLDRRLFLAKNSFGTAWGDQGYCWIPFDYIEQEGYDMWVFELPID